MAESDPFSSVAPIDSDVSDMPELMDQVDFLRSSLSAVIPSARPAGTEPIVVAFECHNTSKAEDFTCVICLDKRHAKTNELIRLAKCCHCPLHLTCVYKWLAAQYDSYVPKDKWDCPLCRAPVKDLATNNDPCILCGQKELDAAYLEPVAQAVPCCSASVHQQCLYNYIHSNFVEDRFPCPGCGVSLGAQRSMTMSIQADPPYMQHIDFPTTPSPPPYTGMITRSRARGRGYQLHRGQQTPLRRPHSDF